MINISDLYQDRTRIEVSVSTVWCNWSVKQVQSHFSHFWDYAASELWVTTSIWLWSNYWRVSYLITDLIQTQKWIRSWSHGDPVLIGSGQSRSVLLIHSNNLILIWYSWSSRVYSFFNPSCQSDKGAGLHTKCHSLRFKLNQQSSFVKQSTKPEYSPFRS